MRRRALLFAAAFGLLVMGLSYPTLSHASSCDECEDQCNQIPMETQECLQMYCPECASVSLSVEQ